jgi:pimeloyl-ACP methyl ester carboxylesterase
VLSSCDAYDRFLPPPVNMLPPLAALPGQVWFLLQVTRPRWVQRLPIAFGWLTKRPIPKEIVASYLGPARRSREIRRDLKAILRAVDKRYTLEAAEDFAKVDIPVLLAWAQDDRLFPVKMARRLEDELPNATLVEIPDSYTFTPEDQPAALAELVVGFLRS